MTKFKNLLNSVSLKDNKFYVKKGFVNKQLPLNEILYVEDDTEDTPDNVFKGQDTFMLSKEVADKVSDGIIGIVALRYPTLQRELRRSDVAVIYKSSAKKIRQRRIDETIFPYTDFWNFETEKYHRNNLCYDDIEFYDYWTNDSIYIVTDYDIYVTTESVFYDNSTPAMAVLPYPQLNIYGRNSLVIYYNTGTEIIDKRVFASKICVGGTFDGIPYENTIKNLIDTTPRMVSAIQSSPNNMDLSFEGNLRLSAYDYEDMGNTNVDCKATYYHLGMIALGKSQAHIQTKEEAREYYRRAVLPKDTNYSEWKYECLMQELINNDTYSGYWGDNEKLRHRSLAVLFNQNIINFIENKEI